MGMSEPTQGRPRVIRVQKGCGPEGPKNLHEGLSQDKSGEMWSIKISDTTSRL